jgi:hypothetical protein
MRLTKRGKIPTDSAGPVAHICNPCYSGCKGQEDHSLKLTQANSSQDPMSKTLNTEMSWWSGSSCRL